MLRSLVRALVVTATLAMPSWAETVAFQSRLNQNYVGVDPSGLLAASARGPQALVLDMVRLEGNRVAFRDPQSGLFLRAGVGSQTHLMVASPHIRGWETFEMVQDGPDVVLRAVQNGLFVGVDPQGARLRAASAHARQAETYRLVPVGQPSQRQAAPAPLERPVQFDLPFAGDWVLDELVDSGIRNDRALRQARMTIGRRGAINGNSGCNTFSATLLETGPTFRVTQLLTTRRGCQGLTREIEDMLYQHLRDTQHFSVNRAGRLELRDSRGRIRAYFRRG
ncbi:MAG: META domain-containing protein [Paracoccaceae bacterium]